MFFRRRNSYNREESLEAARKAQARGRIKKAIAIYMEILKAEPDYHPAHEKVAPLLARKKRFEEAWTSFKAAAAAHLSAGFTQKAIGIYAHALNFMPRNPQVWEAMADVYLEKGKKADALQTLHKGHRYFRKKPYMDMGIRFLRKAFAIEPWNFDVTFDLAGLLKKIDRVEAFGLLEGLADHVMGKKRRKVRFAMFFMHPGLSIAWKWLRAV